MVLVLGDANNDGVLDFTDLIAIEKNFGTTGTTSGTLMGDANDDGRVDGDDFVFFERQATLAMAAAGTTSAVPEPGSTAIVLTGMALPCMRRRPT